MEKAKQTKQSETEEISDDDEMMKSEDGFVDEDENRIEIRITYLKKINFFHFFFHTNNKYETNHLR